jgi:glycine C-acetyltransferase/8-amino-7-oxononanoate synthase
MVKLSKFLLYLFMFKFFQTELNTIKSLSLYRELKAIENTDGRIITINRKDYLNFCSNNYLGLTHHPKVIQAAKKAIEKFGTGAGASRLICGTTVLHQELEERLAKFKGREAAIVFPTGYMANLGTISALVDENDTVIIDRLNHASIVDACRLSRAKLQVYPHKDMKALEKVLNKSGKYKKRLIVTDSVFSMDGDIAPLPQIVELATKYDAITMIDEAHATGVIGKGSGIEEHFGIEGHTDIVTGTLSKALGSLGGFVCGSFELIDYLRNKARSFIYTTALPPANCAAALAALDIIEKQPEFRQKLLDNIMCFDSKLTSHYPQPDSQLTTHNSQLSPIIPIIIGDANQTMEISNKLFEKGIFVSGIRPPTVPKGESRLRVTITALHTKEDLECLASSLQALIPAAAKL